MRSLPIPDISVDAVLGALGPGPRSAVVRGLKAELEEGQEEFIDNAVLGDSRLTGQGHPNLSEKDEENIVWTWRNRLSAKSGSARFVYDSLRSSAPGNRCPLCLHRVVHDLDHFLPKSKYPRLAIVPANLVPICSDCNGLKRSFVALTPDEEPLHPYFDDLGQEPWLRAEVLEQPGAPVLFSVSAPSSWSETLEKRVNAHFERLGLGALYSDLAATLLSNIALLLERRLKDGGWLAVRHILTEMADTWDRPGNEPYLAASLRAWAKSDYVCQGDWLPQTLQVAC